MAQVTGTYSTYDAKGEREEENKRHKILIRYMCGFAIRTCLLLNPYIKTHKGKYMEHI